jgi:hypothetical protein
MAFCVEVQPVYDIAVVATGGDAVTLGDGSRARCYGLQEVGEARAVATEDIGEPQRGYAAAGPIRSEGCRVIIRDSPSSWHDYRDIQEEER